MLKPPSISVYVPVCSERLKRDIARAEDKFDKRLEIYMQSVKKNRKRPRICPEEEGEEMVSSLLLTREKLKVEVRIIPSHSSSSLTPSLSRHL
jgi:hypothetical protein